MNYIDVKILENHVYDCGCIIIGRCKENNATTFRFSICDGLKDKWLYLDFEKPDGTKFKTPRIDIVDGIALYPIPNNLLDVVGELKVEVIFQDESGLVWKSFRKKYRVEEAICATDEIGEAAPDFIANAQQVINQAENLDVTATKENNIATITITRKDGTQETIELEDGTDYVITEEDYQKIANITKPLVEASIEPTLNEIKEVSEHAEVIARGRATGYVFDTLTDLEIWLQDETNVSNLVLGDNFYIRALDTPDYWWDGTTKQQLEAEKPDLTIFVEKEDVAEEQYTITYEDGTTKTIKAVVYK